MSPADFPPVDSEFVSTLIGNFGLGDEGNLLSKIEVNIFLAVDSLNFEQANTVVLIPKAALVAKDGTIDMKLRRSGRHDLKLQRVQTTVSQNSDKKQASDYTK